MARIFAPDDFGAIAMAMLFLQSSGLFVGLGMGPSVIHSDLDRHKVAFHAFTISTFSSIVITIFGLTNSWWIAGLVGDPAVEPILRALMITLVLDAWTVVPTAVLSKDLKFAPVYASQMLSRLVYLGVAIVLGVYGLGVWSLVIANLASSVSTVIVLWAAAPNRYWLKPVPWDWDIVKSLFRYSSRITGSAIANFFGANVDDWIVARRLGAFELGLYVKAYDFTTSQTKAFGSSVVGGVFFPAYTKIRDNEERLRRAYLASARLITTILFPMGFGFLATAPLLIPVVLGDKWIGMITTFQVFSVRILTMPISSNTSSVFKAVGKPQNNMYAGIVRIIGVLPLTLLLVQYGIVGVAMAVLIADVIVMFFTMYQIDRLLPGSAVQTFVSSVPAFVSGAIMFVAVVISLNYLTAALGENAWSLIAAIAIGVAVYGAVILVVQREFTINLILTAIKSFDKKGRLSRFTAKRKELA